MVRSDLGDLRSKGRGKILTFVAGGWFLSIGIRFAYPTLLPFFRAQFDISLTVAGWLLSVLWIAYALGQFPGGILGDRFGEGNILVVSTGISTLAILLVISAISLEMLFVGTIAFGAATALYGPIRYTIFTDIYDDRSGTAIGVTQSIGSIGNTVLPAFTATVATYATWQLGFGVLLPLFVGITLGLWLFVPSRTSEAREARSLVPGGLFTKLFHNITRNGIPIIVTIQIILGFISQGFLGFFPLYLTEVKRFSPQTAGIIFSCYFAVGILVQPLTGICKDRYGSRLTLGFLVGLYFVGLIALQFVHSLLLILLVTVMLSHRNGTGVVSNTFVANALPDDIKSAGLGFLRTGWILIGAVSPIIVGYFGDMGWLRAAFFLLAALAGIALLLSMLVHEP